MDAEGSDRKTSSPFLASVFRFFRGFLVLLSLALGALGRRFFFLFCTYCAFSAEGFWFGPFERSGRLGVQFALVVPLSAEGFFRFALIVRLMPRVFGLDLLESRSSLAFSLHLLCL